MHAFIFIFISIYSKAVNANELHEITFAAWRACRRCNINILISIDRAWRNRSGNREVGSPSPQGAMPPWSVRENEGVGSR